MQSTRKQTPEGQQIINIVYCGGTISSFVTKDGYRKGGKFLDLFSVLEKKYPDRLQNVLVGESQVAYTGLSENMGEKNWDLLYKLIVNCINKNEASVLVTCGTDCMEQTAKYLESKCDALLARKKLKVILTGANDDTSHPRTDAWDNLLFAINATISHPKSGVFIAFHGRIIPAMLAVKEPYNGQEMNYISNKSLEYINTKINLKKNNNVLIEKLKQSIAAKSDSSDKVIAYHANVVRTNHSWLNKVIKSKQIIAVLLVLYHSGSTNTDNSRQSVLSTIEKFRKDGVVFFGVSENGEPIDLHAYITSVTLLKVGVIPLYNMNPDLAFEKLKMVVSKSPVDTINKMITNYVGEIDTKLINSNDIQFLSSLYQNNTTGSS